MGTGFGSKHQTKIGLEIQTTVVPVSAKTMSITITCLMEPAFHRTCNFCNQLMYEIYTWGNWFQNSAFGVSASSVSSVF